MQGLLTNISHRGGRDGVVASCRGGAATGTWWVSWKLQAPRSRRESLEGLIGIAQFNGEISESRCRQFCDGDPW
jgi:hypothetical protein